MRPYYRINYAAFTNKEYRDQQVVNPVNGLIAIQTNLNKSVPSQSICDQSTIALLRLVHNGSNFAVLNSPLPDDFESSGVVRTLDCSRSRTYGLQMMRALDDYQKDCWAFCFDTGVAGFRKALGSPYDDDFQNGYNTTVDVFDRNLSNVLVRLLTCDTASWFDHNITALVFNVFVMCSSSPACASLCSGIKNETGAELYQQIYLQVVGVARNATEDDKALFLTPSTVDEFVQPIAQVASLFGESIEENAAGSNVAQYIDTLANPKSGTCKAYDSVMANLRSGTGGDLSPFPQFAASDSLPAVRAVRSPAFAACQDAIQGLLAACSRKDTAVLCARADDPNVATIGSFDTCDDSGLLVYRTAVLKYNDKCGGIGLGTKPTNGPVRQYLLSHPGGRIDMADCFQDKQMDVIIFFALFMLAWVLILAALALAKRSGRVWLASCDVTMDISRSRAFTVTGTLWLLYFFYRFTTDFLKTIQLNRCTEPWPLCGGMYFPFVIYLFVVCFMWVAAFTWIFQANNPHRRHGPVLSLGGVCISHYFTYLMSMQCMQDLDLGGNTFPLRCQKLFEVGLVCFLQLAMDLCYLHVCVGVALGWKSFHQIRGEEYARVVANMMSGKAAREGASARLFVTCAVLEGSKPPSASQIAAGLAKWVGGMGRFVLVSVSDTAPPKKDHLQRAAQLKVDGSVAGIYCVEMLMVRDSKARRDVLRSEAANVSPEDTARLKAELDRSKNDYEFTRKDAVSLARILGSELFAGALGDAREEGHFRSAVAALHDFCRSCVVAQPGRAAEETRHAFLRAAEPFDICPRHLELICSASEDIVKALTAELDCSEDARSTVGAMVRSLYEAARPVLAARLLGEEFLTWLDSCAVDDVREIRSNSFSQESAALFIFCQSEFLPRPDSKLSVSAAVAEMVRVAKDEDLRHSVERGELVGRVLSVSRDRDCWATWATDPDDGFLARLLGKRGSDDEVAFTPSILFICVGISVMIILTNFVSQLSGALQSQGSLFSLVGTLTDVSSLLLNLALGGLDVAGCVDPVQLQQMAVSPAVYAQDLAQWPPLAEGLNSALQDPTVQATLLKALTPTPEEIASGNAQSAAIASLQATLPGLLLPSIVRVLLGLTSPSVVATLPVYGPLIQCLMVQSQSREVQNFLGQALSIVDAQTSQASKIHVSTSNDPCRRAGGWGWNRMGGLVGQMD